MSSDALTVAVRQLHTDPEATVTTCRRALESAPEDQLPRLMLVLGWADLALDDLAAAQEPLRLAAGSPQDVAGPAALLHGFVCLLLDEAHTVAGSWHRALAEGGPTTVALLRDLDFTADLTGQLNDAAIWSCLDWGAAMTQPGAPSVLPRLLRRWTPEHGFLAALAAHAVHRAHGDRESAHRAVEQATGLGHPRLAAVAWLALAESLVLRKETPAAMAALRQAIDTAEPGQHPLPWPFGSDDEPGVDLATRARTLLGTLQRDAGDVEAALTTLAGVAHSEDPTAIFVRAQTLLRAGANEAARAECLRLVDTTYAMAASYDLGLLAFRDGDDDSARGWWLRVVAGDDPKRAHDAVYNLGLVAKRRRDLPEASRWFGRVVDSGHQDGPLAAAHLGELCYWLGDEPAALRWYQHTLDRTDDPELVAEAACRAGEILHRRGEPNAARPLLERAAAAGVADFAERAASLLR